MDTLGIDIGGSSIKLAAIAGGRVAWTGQSLRYDKPDLHTLIDALRSAAGGRSLSEHRVGLCVPGLLHEDRSSVIYSANLPVLNGIKLVELVSQAWGEPEAIRVVNDALAAAVDIAESYQLAGRMLALALGTGVGAALLDNGTPVLIDGDSPGHIGQIDVSLTPDAPLGPDGGAGSLEGYLGTPALIARYGSMERFFAAAQPTDPPIQALVRAIRICHAIYRPGHIILLGGVGIRMKGLVDSIKSMVNRNLTQVADRDWTLRTGEHDFHAAIGAARLALKR